MPLSTIIVLAALFALFGGFILIVGGTNLYVLAGERAARRRVRAPAPEMRERHALAARI